MTYPEQLRSVLTYHIVEGLLPVSALSGELTTINEATLLVEGDQSALPVGGATIVAPDIAATNGVIHGTSAMLVPPATPKG